MKEKLLAITKSMAALCACTILFSLVFAALYYFHIVSQTTFHTLNWLFGALAYFFAGVLLGMEIKKKALLHALLLIAVIAVIGFMRMDGYTVWNIAEFCSKLIAYACGCMLITYRRKDA